MRTRIRLFALVGVLALAAVACNSAGPATPEPTGVARFSSNEAGISFDYPAAWRLIGQDQTGDLVHRTIAVVGTGSWSGAGCTTFGNSASCKDGEIAVGPGQIVVRVYRDHQFGPAMVCDPSPTANATLGSVVARQTGSATDRIWEIREPSTPYFGAQNNLWIEARTDDSVQMARAEALVASVKLDSGIAGVDCFSFEPSST